MRSELGKQFTGRAFRLSTIRVLVVLAASAGAPGTTPSNGGSTTYEDARDAGVQLRAEVCGLFAPLLLQAAVSELNAWPACKRQGFFV